MGFSFFPTLPPTNFFLSPTRNKHYHLGRGLCIDVSRVHDVHGNAATPSQNGTLRHADINHVLSQRAQEKIDKYRAGYAAQGVRKAFLPRVGFRV